MNAITTIITTTTTTDTSTHGNGRWKVRVRVRVRVPLQCETVGTHYDWDTRWVQAVCTRNTVGHNTVGLQSECNTTELGTHYELQ
eukprot:5699211-Pyramimonas_sp.AAC.1